MKKLKVLFCERASSGHRKIYLKYLSQIENIESYIYAPECEEEEKNIFYKYEYKNNSIVDYMRWIDEISSISKEHQIDIVHFLDGDSIMRYFGWKFKHIPVKKIIITYHHLWRGFIKKLGYKKMCKVNKCIPVVHTQNFSDSLSKTLNKEVMKCEYPAFDIEEFLTLDSQRCKEKIGINKKIPVIGIIGGISSYKNIPIFLRVLNECKENFQLIIFGKLDDITQDEILKEIKNYKEKVFLKLQKLTDSEYREAITASDIIYCIYSKQFDGASGPMMDGVLQQKLILASDHGSLGSIVNENDLGLTVDCNDTSAILKSVEKALSLYEKFSYNEKAEKFRLSLNPHEFQKKYYNIYCQNMFV